MTGSSSVRCNGSSRQATHQAYLRRRLTDLLPARVHGVQVQILREVPKRVIDNIQVQRGPDIICRGSIATPAVAGNRYF